MSQQTSVTHLYGRGPKRIQLLGDKMTRPEPATHIIEFPGGAIELSRTSDDKYWAHIIVNRDFALGPDAEGMVSSLGEIVGSRIDYEFPADPNIVDVPKANMVRQIAILIQPIRGHESPAPAMVPLPAEPAHAGVS